MTGTERTGTGDLAHGQRIDLNTDQGHVLRGKSMEIIVNLVLIVGFQHRNNGLSACIMTCYRIMM